jgi:hypothetical protein
LKIPHFVKLVAEKFEYCDQSYSLKNAETFLTVQECDATGDGTCNAAGQQKI